MDSKARRHQKEKEQAAEAKKNPPAKMSNKLVLVFILVPVGVLLLAFIITWVALKAARVF
jgi:flagellar basal body-associated protein FliL